MKKITIQDIARLAGVSPSSVSRVISGRNGVSGEKRIRIRRVIEETGYVPSVIARSLVRGRSNVVGVVVRDLANQYYAAMAVEFQRELRKYGYIPLVMSVNPGGQPDTEHFSEIYEAFDFAALFVSVPCRERQVAEIIEAGRCPVILLNRTFESNCDQVIQNDYRAGAMAAEYFLKMGHRRVMTVAGPYKESISCRLRMEGFAQTLAINGIELGEKDIIECWLDTEAARTAAERMLGSLRSKRPFGIFVSGNSMALGVLSACADHGLAVPDDVSIVTVDDPPVMRLPGINLTTISVAMEQMVKNAVKVLRQRLSGEADQNRFIVLQPELIERGSVLRLSAPETV